jgi:hypothetical protein
MVEIAQGVLEKLVLASIALAVIPLGLLFSCLSGYFDRKAPYDV